MGRRDDEIRELARGVRELREEVADLRAFAQNDPVGIVHAYLRHRPIGGKFGHDSFGRGLIRTIMDAAGDALLDGKITDQDIADMLNGEKGE